MSFWAVCLVFWQGLPACAELTAKTGACWARCYNGDQLVMAHLLEAVSGKRTGERTRNLINGVTQIVREENDFRLVRADGAELLLPRDSEFGERWFSCMEKIESDARKKIGNEAGEYVKSVNALVVDGDAVELRHSGKEDVHVPLPTNQPWLPVRLKELKLRNIRLKLVEGSGKESHRIKSIDGIAAVVHSAGMDVNIEPREFWRFKDKHGKTHVVFGFRSLVPKPVRDLFRLPEIVHVNLTVKGKKERTPETQS